MYASRVMCRYNYYSLGTCNLKGDTEVIYYNLTTVFLFLWDENGLGYVYVNLVKSSLYIQVFFSFVFYHLKHILITSWRYIHAYIA